MRSRPFMPLVLAIAASVGAQRLNAQTVLSVGTSPAYPGVPANVPVSLARATNAAAAQFDVAFNPSRATVGTPFGDPSGRHTVLSREIAPGVQRVLVFSRQNAVMTNRNIARLPVTLAPAEYVGAGPLTPANALVARRDGTRITPVALESGTVFVRPVNLLPDGRVQFFLPATPDQRYYIQASTNLSSWVNISTNVASGTFLDLIDIDAASYPYRFYRWQAAQ
jgi:hypothetical protein